MKQMCNFVSSLGGNKDISVISRHYRKINRFVFPRVLIENIENRKRSVTIVSVYFCGENSNSGG